jgi:hypothetical protein
MRRRNRWSRRKARFGHWSLTPLTCIKLEMKLRSSAFASQAQGRALPDPAMAFDDHQLRTAAPRQLAQTIELVLTADEGGHVDFEMRCIPG